VSGLATTDHVVPFHCSARVWSTDPGTWWPTAMQNPVATQEVSARMLSTEVPTFGVTAVDQGYRRAAEAGAAGTSAAAAVASSASTATNAAA
jgi:hypothetical protein